MRCFSGILLIAITLAAAGPGKADEWNQPFLEGLRARRLYELAETLCRQQLDKTGQSPREQVQWTLELQRTLAQHALQAPRSEQAALWERARQVAADFQQAAPAHPRGLLVRVQDALTLVARGEALRQESEVAVDPSQLRAEALTQLRAADRLLNDLEKEIDEAILRAGGRRGTGAEDQAAAAGLDRDELFALQSHVEYQRGRVLRNRGLCYEPGSTDRLAALSSAIEQLKKPMPRVGKTDPLRWDLLLDQAECLRLLEQYDAAQQLLLELASAPGSGRQKLRRQAELLRLKTAQGGLPPDSGDPPLVGRTVRGEGGAEGAVEWDLAVLEYLLHHSQSAPPAQAKAWLEQATAAVRRIEELHGPYWGRRAEVLLVRAAGDSAVAGNAEILGRSADELYRKGAWEDAVQTYRRAAAAARQENQRPAAFAWEYKAGLVLQEQRLPVAAAELFQELSLDHRQDPRAAEVHLLATWNAYQAARQDQQLVDRYVLLLDEQISTWPASEATDQARLWLGQLYEARRQWREAAQVYQDVPPTNRRITEAIEGVARSWDAYLSDTRLSSEQRSAGVDEASGYYQRLLPDEGGSWTPAAQTAILQAAALWLRYEPERARNAEQLLERALREGPESADWRAAVRTLRVTALAASGRLAEAGRQLEEIAGGEPEALLQLVDNLGRLVPQNETSGSQKGDSETLRKALASLQLEAVEQLRGRASLSSEQQQRLARAEAEALAAAGRVEEAIEAYRRLTAAFPDEGDLQRALGRCLLRGETTERWEEAAEQWRIVAARTRPQTDDWYEAKWAIAQAQLKLGQAADAAQRIKYLRATGGWGPPPWPERFQKLLVQCESR